jgi:hypothetical protein
MPSLRSIATATVATVFALVPMACSPDQAPSEEESFTRITFSETQSRGKAEDPLQQHIDMYVAHQDGTVKEIRFRVQVGDELSQERRWEAAASETIIVRSWLDCSQFSEPMPPPAPESLDIVLEELFGPREIPSDADTTSDGSASWTMESGLAVLTVVDHGGEYPDRTITVGGEIGSIGTILEAGGVDSVSELPDWQSGWESCTPISG